MSSTGPEERIGFTFSDDSPPPKPRRKRKKKKKKAESVIFKALVEHEPTVSAGPEALQPVKGYVIGALTLWRPI